MAHSILESNIEDKKTSELISDRGNKVLLSPQLHKLSSGSFTSLIEPVTSVVAAVAFRYQFG